MNETMMVVEAIKSRRELEKKLSALINEFRESTGLRIEQLWLEPIDVIGETEVRAHVEVRPVEWCVRMRSLALSFATLSA